MIAGVIEFGGDVADNPGASGSVLAFDRHVAALFGFFTLTHGLWILHQFSLAPSTPSVEIFPQPPPAAPEFAEN